MKRDKSTNSPPRLTSQESWPDDSDDMTSAPPMTSFVDLFTRLTWMALGPLALLVTSILNVSQGGGWFTLIDGVFFVVLGSMLFARWLEFHRGNPMNSEGRPAKPSDLPRYELSTLAIGLLIWFVTNVVGNYNLMFKR